MADIVTIGSKPEFKLPPEEEEAIRRPARWRPAARLPTWWFLASTGSWTPRRPARRQRSRRSRRVERLERLIAPREVESMRDP